MMGDKEYHLYLYRPQELWQQRAFCLTAEEVEYAIELDRCIHTTQIITCTTRLFGAGYRIFVHPKPGDRFEITLGRCERTNREIRTGHCLYGLILSGEFEEESENG